MWKTKVSTRSSKSTTKRTSEKAGLLFPVARVARLVRRQIKGIRLDSSVKVALAAILEESANIFMESCLKQMSEKDKAVNIVKAKHCAKALADESSSFYGIFPTKVAGIYIKNE